MPKRRASGPLTPPRTPTRRRLFKGAVGTAARAAAASNPYGRAAMGAYRAAKFGFQVYNTAKKTVKAKSGSKGSAANSKSVGKFKASKAKTNKMDAAAQKGFVSRREIGSVVTDSANQVVYLAQSTMPQRLVETTLFKSLIKRLLQEAGMAIKNENVPLLNNQYYNSLIKLDYKVKDGAVVVTHTWTITKTSTLVSVANDMYSSFNGWAGTTNLPQQLLRINFYADFSGSISDAWMLQSSLDLTSARVEIQSTSDLKVQNRTLNSTGNDQADDVDNVPVDGKFFEFRTNSTVFRDYGTPGAALKQGISTNPDYGTLPTYTVDTTGTSMYDKIPLTSQFVGVKRQGNAHLDPGEIKTSSISDSESMLLSKLIYTLYAKSSAAAGVGITQCWLGKTRLFAYEKMINAVAMSATNQFNIAYEHMVQIGVILKIHKNFHTAPSTSTIIA